MRMQKNQETGLIKLIFLLAVIIFFVSMFGFDLRSAFESQTTKDNFTFVWEKVSAFWTGYGKPALQYVWNVIKPIADFFALEQNTGTTTPTK